MQGAGNSNPCLHVITCTYRIMVSIAAFQAVGEGSIPFTCFISPIRLLVRIVDSQSAEAGFNSLIGCSALVSPSAE